MHRTFGPFLFTLDDVQAKVPGLRQSEPALLLVMMHERLATGETILLAFEKRDHAFMILPTAGCQRRLRELATS